MLKKRYEGSFTLDGSEMTNLIFRLLSINTVNRNPILY